MRRPAFRLLAASSLVASVLALSACQTLQLPSGGGGANVPAPQAAVEPPPPPPPPPPSAAPPPAVAREALAGNQTLPQQGPAGLPLPQGNPVRVALLLPLSGEAAAVGSAMFNAAQMAMFERAGEDFTLLPFDTRGTAEGAAAAAQQAVTQGVDLILGPLFSKEVKAATPVVQAAGLNMVAFTTDSTAAGNGVYILSFLLRTQMERLVEHARSQGLTRFAAFAPDTEEGRASVQALEEAVHLRGGMLADIAYYDPNATDFSAAVKSFARSEARRREVQARRSELAGRTDSFAQQALRRLEAAGTAGDPGYDALLIPDRGTRLKTVTSHLAYQDAIGEGVRVLGTMLWAEDRLGAEPTLLGAWYPAAAKATYDDFAQRYGRAFGSRPPSIASLAYDATALAAVLAQQPERSFNATALTNPSGFIGVAGLFRLRSDGTADRGLTVMEVSRDGDVEVAPAAQTFQPQMGY